MRAEAPETLDGRMRGVGSLGFHARILAEPLLHNADADVGEVVAGLGHQPRVLLSGHTGALAWVGVVEARDDLQQQRGIGDRERDGAAVIEGLIDARDPNVWNEPMGWLQPKRATPCCGTRIDPPWSAPIAISTLSIIQSGGGSTRRNPRLFV